MKAGLMGAAKEAAAEEAKNQIIGVTLGDAPEGVQAMGGAGMDAGFGAAGNMMAK